MKNFFLDTWILIRIACKRGASQLEMQQQWDTFVSLMGKHFPGCLENFEWVVSDRLFLEIIGLSKVKEKKGMKNKKDDDSPQLLAFSYEPLKSSVKRNEWKDFYPDAVSFVKHIVERIDNFIEKELKSRNLFRQAISFDRSYPKDSHNCFIFSKIKRWSKAIRNEKLSVFTDFRNNIMWDTIFRYPWIDLAQIAPKERYKAACFEGEVAAVLFKQYYEVYTRYYSLEVSSLGLFAEIYKVDKYYNDYFDEGEATYDSILKPWSDMADADSIHYALAGKRRTLTRNEPVIVVTGDKKEDVEKRLECLYTNLCKLAEKGFKIELCPGVIICCNDRDGSIKMEDPIKVQDVIDGLQKNKSDE